MEIQSATSTAVSYMSSPKQKETISNEKFDMNKIFDIKTFSFDYYKNITSEDLEKWIKNGEHPEDAGNASFLNAMASHTEDDDFNEILFNKAKDEFDRTGKFMQLTSTVLVPLSDMMSGGKNPIANPETIGIFLNSNNPEFLKENTVHQESDSDQYRSIRTKTSFFKIDEIISTLEGVTEYYQKNKDSILWGDNIEGVFSNVSDILNMYEAKKNENNATLNNYTKNTKYGTIYV